MKSIKSSSVLWVLLTLALACSPGAKVCAQDVDVSYQDFYDDLSPYGQWMDDPQYGNVWVPNEGEDFQPYGSNGYWEMTDEGNTWVSNEPWGWICYHYGRWMCDDYYGWVWIPGYEWAPAWVSWRYGDGYCGWAPLGPDMGVDGDYSCPDNWWCFVGSQYMYQPEMYRHRRPPHDNRRFVHRTAAVHNHYTDKNTHVRYNFGPKASVVASDTHIPVRVYHLAPASKPGAPATRNGTLSLYRPDVNKVTVLSAKPSGAVPVPMPLSKPQISAVPRAHQRLSAQNGQQQVKSNSSVAGAQNVRNSMSANNPTLHQSKAQREANRRARRIANRQARRAANRQWQSQQATQQMTPQANSWQNRNAAQNNLGQQYRSVQNWPRSAPMPSQNWPRPAPMSSQNWSRPAPMPSQNWSRPAPVYHLPSMPAPGPMQYSGGGRR